MNKYIEFLIKVMLEYNVETPREFAMWKKIMGILRKLEG